MPRKAKASAPKPDDLADLKLQTIIGSIQGKYGKGSIILAGATDYVQTERIPFNHPVLDETTRGGVPRGLVTVLIGDPGAGKTTATLELIASAQQMGIKAALIDTEHAFDRDYAECLGVDPDELLFAQPGTAEEALDIFEMLVKSGAVGLVICDSVAAMGTKAEIEGTIEDKQVGDKARVMSKAMRKIVPAAKEHNVAAVFVHQWRIDIKTGNKDMPAGKALKFASSLTLDFARKQTIYKKTGEDQVPTGQVTIVKVPKSRVSIPFSKCEIELKYAQFVENEIVPRSGGFNRTAAYVDAALDSGKLIQKGAWFKLPPDENIAQGRDNLIKLLESKPEMMEKIK